MLRFYIVLFSYASGTIYLVRTPISTACTLPAMGTSHE